MGKKRYVSSTDLARLAGVSQSAVSRTFTEGASVSPGTREKVLAAARALGYRPNFLPQALMSNRSRLVAVAVGAVTNPFYASVLEQFTAALQDAGQQVALIRVASDYALDAVLDRIADYRVDALVSALAVLSPDTARALSALRIPVVCFNGRIRAEWVLSVSPDNLAAGAEAADHLVEAGGRRFAFLSGPPGSPATDARPRCRAHVAANLAACVAELQRLRPCGRFRPMPRLHHPGSRRMLQCTRGGSVLSANPGQARCERTSRCIKVSCPTKRD